MHKVRRAIRHESYNIVSNDLTIHGLGDVLLKGALVVGLFGINCFALTNNYLIQVVSHRLFELEQYLEKILTQVGEVLFFEELRVDLGKAIKLRVHLIFGDRTLVTDEVLELLQLRICRRIRAPLKLSALRNIGCHHVRQCDGR